MFSHSAIKHHYMKQLFQAQLVSFLQYRIITSLCFCFLTFFFTTSCGQYLINERKRKTVTKVLFLISSTANNTAFLINLQLQPPPWYSVCLQQGEVTYTSVDGDSDCYLWTTGWEDSLIFRLLYWLGLVQRFWLAASLRLQYWHPGSGLDSGVAGLRLSSFD